MDKLNENVFDLDLVVEKANVQVMVDTTSYTCSAACD